MWIGFVTLGLCGGLILGWEKSSYGQTSRYIQNLKLTRLLGLCFLGLIVGSQVESLRGFGVVFLSTVGAFYIASHLSEFIEKQWMRYRNMSPECSTRQQPYTSSSRVFSINTHNMPPAYIETLFLRNDQGRIVKIVNASYEGRELHVDANGWLNLDQVVLERNERVEITVEVLDWSLVIDYRLIGRWANEVSWLFDGTMES